MHTIATLTLLSSVSSREESKIVFWAALGAGFGVYLFFRGFKMLQFKRLILDTPASKVRSASMGLVELSGIPVGPNTIPAGITGDPCFYYRATAWERTQSGSRSEWRRVAEESLFVPFFLQDETGRILVDAQGADMDVHRNFKDEFGGSFFGGGSLPMGTVHDFLLRYGLAGKHVRLEEFCIKPDYPLFVLGTLGENHARSGSAPERHVRSESSSITFRLNSRPMGNGLFQMLGALGGGPSEMSVPPIALSGSTAVPPHPSRPHAVAVLQSSGSWTSVSMDEPYRPASVAKVPTPISVAEPPPEPAANSQMVTSPTAAWPPAGSSRGMSLADTPPLEVTPNSGFDLNAPVAISQGGSRAPFTISSESQRELVSSLGWKSAACIWGGPALTVACVYILLLTLGVM